MRRLSLVASLAAVALLAPAAARANGDPASDVLLTDQVFLPFEAPISKSAQNDLRKTVDEANKKHFKIRVAVIAFTSDLGTAVSLWKHPQSYSEFLGKEIAFVYTGPLLISMPSGRDARSFPISSSRSTEDGANFSASSKNCATRQRYRDSRVVLRCSINVSCSSNRIFSKPVRRFQAPPRG